MKPSELNQILKEVVAEELREWNETKNESSTNWASPVSAYEDGRKNGKADHSLGHEPLGLKAGPSPNQKAYSQGYYDGYYGTKGNEYSDMKFREGYGAGDMSKDPKRACNKCRWTVKYDETITESELKSTIKELINEMWADIGDIDKSTEKEGPTGRSTEPGADKGLVDLYKGGKSSNTGALPSVGGGMSEEICEDRWPTPDEELKQYTDVSDWEKEKLDSTGKYIGEPLKNYGFLYKVGDVVPPGEYNRNNAMHLWNIAKTMEQENIGLGRPVGFQESAKPLYEAKGPTPKDKLRSILKESVHQVLNEYSEREEIQLINSIASISRTAISRTSSMSPEEALRQFKEIDRLAEKLVKMHSEKTGYNPKTGLYDVPTNSEQKTPLGVTQETVSKTKNLLDQMFSQRRKR